MRPAEDAIQIDTTDLAVDEVVARIEQIVLAQQHGMTSADAVWTVGRYTIGTLVRLLTPLRNYGAERVPRTGGVVLRVQPLPLGRPARLRPALAAADVLRRQGRGASDPRRSAS